MIVTGEQKVKRLSPPVALFQPLTYNDLMRRKDNTATGVVPCIIISVLIALIFLSVCRARDIAPFGENVISINSDTQQESIPHLFHAWDFLHGKSPLYYQWYAGTGSSDAGIASHFSMISPFSLFLYFIPRNDIDSLSPLFYLIKLVAAGLAMYFSLSALFRDKGGSHSGAGKAPFSGRRYDLLFITLSVSYAVNAYSMMYLSFGWIDVMALFPLLMYFLIRILDGSPEKDGLQGTETRPLCGQAGISSPPDAGSSPVPVRKLQIPDPLRRNKDIIGYVLLLALTFTVNLPISYMVVIFLILFSGVYLLTGCGGTCRPSLRYTGSRAFILLFASAVAALLSAFSWLPASYDIVTSSRYSSGPESGLISRYLLHCSYMDFFTPLNISYYEPWKKLLIFLGMTPQFAALFLCRAGMREKRRSSLIFELSMLAFSAVPVLFTVVDFVWHFGPYQCFPMRYGFMFIFLAGFLWMRAENEESLFYLERSAPAGDDSQPAFGLPIRNAGRTVIDATFCMLLLSFSVLFTVQNVNKAPDHIAKDYIALSEALENEDADDEGFAGTKMGVPVASDHNYPLVIRRRAVSQYPATGDRRQSEYFKALGYASSGTRNGDDGGTAFSDALLGTGYVFIDKVSPENADFISVYPGCPELYGHAAETDRFTLFRINKTFRPGLTADAGEVRRAAEEAGNIRDPFEFQNLLSRLLFGREILSEGTDSPGISYLWAGERTGLRIDVDGTERSPYFPYGHSNGILPLGYYPEGGETVSVTDQDGLAVPVNTKGNENENGAADPVTVYTLDTELMTELLDEGEIKSRDCTFTRNRCGAELTVRDSDSSRMLYIPVSSSYGWTCVLNGKKVPVAKVKEALFVPLEDGESRISLTWRHPLHIPSLIMTAAGALILAAALAMCLFTGNTEAENDGGYGPEVPAPGSFTGGSRMADLPAAAAFIPVFAMTVLTVYVIPVCIFIFSMLKH